MDFVDCGLDSASLAETLADFRIGSSAVVPFIGAVELVSSIVRFLGGRPLRGVDLGGIFSKSDPTASATGSMEGLDFFGGTREN